MIKKLILAAPLWLRFRQRSPKCLITARRIISRQSLCRRPSTNHNAAASPPALQTFDYMTPSGRYGQCATSNIGGIVTTNCY